MVNEIGIKVGKTYSIKYIIEELKRHPDIRIGHILALNRHQYHLGVEEFEALRNEIRDEEKKDAGLLVYDISGKKRIDASDITILSIIDPYSKYAKYEKFYEDLYKQITDAIDVSTTGVIMATPKDLVEEARKEGFGIEKDADLLDGIYIFFVRRAVEARHITKDKEGTRTEYIVFAREGTIEKEDRSDGKTDKKEKGKGQLVSITEHEAKELKEKTKEFESFYAELEKDVIAFIGQRKDKEGAIGIESIMLEAKKVIPNVENRQDVFMKGLVLYFNGKGVDAEILKDKNFVIFKMV